MPEGIFSSAQRLFESLVLATKAGLEGRGAVLTWDGRNELDDNWEMLKHFVKNNNFVAIVSELSLDKNDSDLVVKNLSKFFPKMSYSILYRKGDLLKPVVEDFIAALKTVVN